jgi:glycine cleavage system H lipoate-binding protein
MMSQQNITRPQMREVFGFQVPIENFYLHRGHAWVALEGDDQVRVGLDHFSQKLLGPAEEVRLPEIGKVYFQDHLCMALIRQGKKASFEAPVDGAIEAINPKVKQKPSLICDDPYGEGWLFTVKPNNLRRNLEKLLSGEDAVIWMEKESHRLLNLMETRIGVTLPTGGDIVDDVYGNYPELGWKLLVQEFFLKHLMKLGLIRPVK